MIGIYFLYGFLAFCGVITVVCLIIGIATHEQPKVRIPIAPEDQDMNKTIERINSLHIAYDKAVIDMQKGKCCLHNVDDLSPEFRIAEGCISVWIQCKCGRISNVKSVAL